MKCNSVDGNIPQPTAQIDRIHAKPSPGSQLGGGQPQVNNDGGRKYSDLSQPPPPSAEGAMHVSSKSRARGREKDVMGELEEEEEEGSDEGRDMLRNWNTCRKGQSVSNKKRQVDDGNIVSSDCDRVIAAVHQVTVAFIDCTAAPLLSYDLRVFYVYCRN